mmetsp:Transcript_36722/g.114355  ORF Transcript_36722/g.114355 Transcript_36722/m.114355 type:complete len:208 (+) Transcript_36722:506-1129(+)
MAMSDFSGSLSAPNMSQAEVPAARTAATDEAMSLLQCCSMLELKLWRFHSSTWLALRRSKKAWQPNMRLMSLICWHSATLDRTGEMARWAKRLTSRFVKSTTRKRQASEPNPTTMAGAMMGATAMTTMLRARRLISSCIRLSHMKPSCVSTRPMSVEKREVMRPFGVASHQLRGARIILVMVCWCRVPEASVQPVTAVREARMTNNA